MAVFVALLRAINVGGAGKLVMTDLVKLCERAGFSNAQTYVQSGNVVFESAAGEAEVKAALSSALARKLGKAVGVFVRPGHQLADVIAHNPFAGAAPNRVLVMFLDEPPADRRLIVRNAPGGEEMVLHGRELFIHFPQGQGVSKLKLPFADVGTTRNLNTVAKLAVMAQAMSPRRG